MKFNDQLHLFFYLIGSLFFWCGCVKNEKEELDFSTFGYDYYPVEIGKSWVYQTDSILYSLKATVEIDSSTSYIREEVVDSFRNQEHKLVYRLDVFHTRDTNQAWELISSSFILKDNTQLQKKESGLDFIKLVFPIRKNSSWYGNNKISPETEIFIQGESLEAYEGWIYRYDYLNTPETIANLFYNNICKVTEVDDENIIHKRYSEAKYAKGIGLVFKEQWILDTQNLNDSIPFENRAQKGMILRQFLLRHN